MKYEYKTATGRQAIEVDERFYDILIELDADEKNSDRKHSRRWPVSLESAGYEGEWFSDGTDITDGLIQSESREQLHAALLRLTPEQQNLIEQVYFKGIAPSEMARSDGVTKSAVSMRLALAYKRIKKFLK
jgi:RNA polymerase sigma factor (sigma-70 family)